MVSLSEGKLGGCLVCLLTLCASKSSSSRLRLISNAVTSSFLRQPRRSQVHPPVVGPQCVTIARTPPPRARAPVVGPWCVTIAPPPPPPPRRPSAVGPRCVTIARPTPRRPSAVGRRSAVCYDCTRPPPSAVGPRRPPPPLWCSTLVFVSRFVLVHNGSYCLDA